MVREESKNGEKSMGRKESMKGEKSMGRVESRTKVESQSLSAAASVVNTIDDSKALVVMDKSEISERERLANEKRMNLIKAWEENEKTKAFNKAHRRLTAVGSWENTKKATVEAQLKKKEAQFETKKAKKREQMKNRMAEIHHEAEMRRAYIENRCSEDQLKTEEIAKKYRTIGFVPKKILGCFNGVRESYLTRRMGRN